MRTYTIPAGDPCFTFKAAFLCEACGERVREALTRDGKAPANPDDEHTYDSDNFPKGPYDAEQDETCDAMDGCLSLPEIIPFERSVAGCNWLPGER